MALAAKWQSSQSKYSVRRNERASISIYPSSLKSLGSNSSSRRLCFPRTLLETRRLWASGHMVRGRCLLVTGHRYFFQWQSQGTSSSRQKTSEVTCGTVYPLWPGYLKLSIIPWLKSLGTKTTKQTWQSGREPWLPKIEQWWLPYKLCFLIKFASTFLSKL